MMKKTITLLLLVVSLSTYVCSNPYKDFIIEESFSFIRDMNYDQAQDSLYAMLESDPYNSKIYFYRALTHYMKNDISETYNDAKKFLSFEENTNDYYGHILMGLIQSRRLLSNIAVKEYDHAIRIKPDEKLAYIEKAKVYAFGFNLSRAAEPAVHQIKLAIKKFPNEDKLKLYKAYTMLRTNDVDEAINDFHDFLNSSSAKDTSQLYASYLGLSSGHLRNNNLNKALYNINKALQISPDKREALELRGEIYYNQKKYNDALKDFLKIDEKLHSMNMSRLIVDIYVKNKQINNALEYYKNKLYNLDMINNDHSHLKKLEKLKKKYDKSKK